MALPIAHRIDHEIWFIHEDDGAWDHDRIKYELAVIEGRRAPESGRPVPEGKRSDHPWVRFVSGRSRGDLKSAEEYLLHKDGDQGPTKFRFERIGFDAWSSVEALDDQGLSYERTKFVLRVSLKSVTGLEFEGGHKRGEPLTLADIEMVRDTFGDEVFEAIGAFAFRASRSLVEAEKKS